MQFKELNQTEEHEFRQWARDNQDSVNVAKAQEGLYHPIIIDEYRKLGVMPRCTTGLTNIIIATGSDTPVEYKDKKSYILIVPNDNTDDALIFQASTNPKMLLNTLDAIVEELAKECEGNMMAQMVLAGKLCTMGEELLDGTLGIKHS